MVRVRREHGYGLVYTLLAKQVNREFSILPEVGGYTEQLRRRAARFVKLFRSTVSTSREAFFRI